MADRRREPRDLTLGLRVLAYSGDIERARLEVQWADRALAWLDTQKAAASPDSKND